MKRLLSAIIIALLTVTLITPLCYADDTEVPEVSAGEEIVTPETVPETSPEVETKSEGEETPTESAPNMSETPENLAQDTNADIIDQLIGIVTNGEIWAKIGVTVLGALALMLVLRSSLDKIVGMFNGVKELIAGKATKEDTEKLIKDNLNVIRSECKNQHSEHTVQYNALTAQINKMTAIISILANYLVKSPNARASIMDILSETKISGDDVAEFVEAVEAEIDNADALTPKPETPALDAVKAIAETEKINIVLE